MCVCLCVRAIGGLASHVRVPGLGTNTRHPRIYMIYSKRSSIEARPYCVRPTDHRLRKHEHKT